MKKRLTSPTFDASAQTVTHASFSDVTLAGIQLIVNVTDQVIIYNFADSAKGGTLSTDTLTLEYDTTTMDDTDELMVLVEDGTTTQVVSGTVTSNIASGSVAITAGTVSAGTVDLLKSGTITRLEQGSITVTAGTVVNNGGSVSTMGTFIEASGSATSAGADLISSTDVSAYKWVSIQMMNTWVGTVNLQVSNDNSTFFNHPVVADSALTGGISANITSNNIYHAHINARYARLRLSSYTSGTAQAVTEFYTSPSMLQSYTVGAAQSGAWSVTGTVAAGSLVVTAGTVSTGTINAGTVDLVKAGTITRLEQGSVNVTAGTIRDDGRPSRNILSYGTTFGAAGAAYGTLVGSAAVGAGTSTWVEQVSVKNPNGDITITVGFGTALNGSSVLLKGEFGTTSAVGETQTYTHAVNAGMTNQDLVVHISGAGTIDVNTKYFISA